MRRNKPLKRSGFKKKTLDQVIAMGRKVFKKAKIARKLKAKKKKKVSISLLKKKLWELTKQKVRNKYLDHRGYAVCYTCDRTLTEKKDMHTAHFIDSSVCGAILRYSMDNLRICCYACNVHKNGNKIEYYRRMVNEVGQEKVDEIYRLSKTLISADTFFYEKMIENYKL